MLKMNGFDLNFVDLKGIFCNFRVKNGLKWLNFVILTGLFALKRHITPKYRSKALLNHKNCYNSAIFKTFSHQNAQLSAVQTQKWANQHKNTSHSTQKMHSQIPKLLKSTHINIPWMLLKLLPQLLVVNLLQILRGGL